jgi:hypothetical protein
MKQLQHAALFLFALCFAGCVNYQPLRLEPVKRTTAIAPKFSSSYYYYDRDRNLQFVLRSESTDRATGKPITQIATIRVFWHPKGGVTTLNRAALNATFRYLVMTPDSVGMYEGAGFVRPSSKDGAARFNARVIDGDMRLTQASANFNDTLGRSHFRGYFSAVYNDARAVDLLIAAHRDFFARSLLSKPPAQPVMSPADLAQDWGIPATSTAPSTAPVMPKATE